MVAWNFAILVDAIARSAPDRVAVVHGNRPVTWHELVTRSRSLAWALTTQAGVRPGDSVVIALSNRPEYLETFVAVRKLRAKPLAIPTTVSVNALHAAIDGSDARLVVCEPAAAADVRAAVRRIQKRWRPTVLETGAPYEEAVAETIPPDDWDLEVPTADDLIAIAEFDASAESAAPGPTVMTVAPFAEGDGFGDLLSALAAKGCVVFPDPPGFDAPRTWEAIGRHGVSRLVIGGDAQARPLLAGLAAGDRGALGSLTTIRSAGEPVSADVAAAFATALPEVTIDGVAAPTVASGATVQSVAPSEVEGRLRKHAGIADCAVLGVSDPRIGKLVVAVVQVKEQHYLDEPELAAWCRAHLPASMTPARFVFTAQIAHTASGQVDDAEMQRVAIERLLDPQ